MPIRLFLSPCSACQAAGLEHAAEPSRVEVREGDLYLETCPNGHTTLVQLQHRPFEVLFEMGTIALLDGYYREAVADFTSALERFLEFYIRYVAYKHGISDADVAETWKLVARQSERQVGAFLFVYAL